MARFLKIPALVTDPGAGVTPWSLGVTGANHRWDPSLLNVTTGTVANTLADTVGDHTLTRSSGGTTDNTVTVEGAIKYLGNLTGSNRIESATDKLLGDKFTIALAMRTPTGYSSVAKVGGYFVENSGNGKIRFYSYVGGSPTGDYASPISYGTGWNIVVASFDGAASQVTINGVHYAATTLATPTTFSRTQLGNGVNPLHLAVAATWPTNLADADRLTVNNAIKTKLGI